MQETRIQSLRWEDPHGEENGSPLQYSYLEYPMDREAWWVIISEVTKELDMTERKKNNKERTKRRL